MLDDVYFLRSKKNIKEFRAKYNFFFPQKKVLMDKIEKYIRDFIREDRFNKNDQHKCIHMTIIVRVNIQIYAMNIKLFMTQ